MPSDVFEVKPILYETIRPTIRNGTIALARPTTIQGRAICRGTGARYSHATMLGWARPNTLMLGETCQHSDARLIDARSEFAAYPGCYDLFWPVSFRYDGDAAWTFICHAAGSKYGWRHLWRVYLRRVLGVDVAPIPNSDLPQWPRDCSALDHAALRLFGGGRLREYDCDVVPGDSSDSGAFEYLGTVFVDRLDLLLYQMALEDDRPLPAEAATDVDLSEFGE